MTRYYLSYNHVTSLLSRDNLVKDEAWIMSTSCSWPLLSRFSSSLISEMETPFHHSMAIHFLDSLIEGPSIISLQMWGTNSILTIHIPPHENHWSRSQPLSSPGQRWLLTRSKVSDSSCRNPWWSQVKGRRDAVIHEISLWLNPCSFLIVGRSSTLYSYKCLWLWFVSPYLIKVILVLFHLRSRVDDRPGTFRIVCKIYPGILLSL